MVMHVLKYRPRKMGLLTCTTAFKSVFKSAFAPFRRSMKTTGDEISNGSGRAGDKDTINSDE